MPVAPVAHYPLYFIITDDTIYTYLFYFGSIYPVTGKVTPALPVPENVYPASAVIKPGPVKIPVFYTSKWGGIITAGGKRTNGLKRDFAAPEFFIIRAGEGKFCYRKRRKTLYLPYKTGEHGAGFGRIAEPHI